MIVAFFIVSGVILLWNVVHAGMIAQARRESRIFLGLTAFSGLLIVPAVVAIATSSGTVGGRAMDALSWLWPATAGFFATQSLYALLRGLVRPLLGVPIVAFNLLVVAGAVARHGGALTPDVPPAILGLGAAQASALGFVFGRSALVASFAIPIPILAPSYPARWTFSRLLRIGLALVAALWTFLYAAEYPRAVRAITTFDAFSAQRIQERPSGDFAIGVRVLPALGRVPPTLPLSNDLALVDTLGAEIISVVLRPSGTTVRSLDSLARAFDRVRGDSTVIVATLGYDAEDRERFLTDPAAYAGRRLAAIDRIVRELRPDVILPARDPFTEGDAALGNVPASWWQGYLTRASRLSHELRPRTRVGLSVSAFTPPESTLYAWAAAAGSPIDVLGFSFFPSYGGGASLAARFRTAEVWMRAHAPSRKPHWIFAIGANPRVFGLRAQERAVWGALAWGTSQPLVRGLIVEGAGDYEAQIGLRSPAGTLRIAAVTVERVSRSLAEVRTAATVATPTSAPPPPVVQP